MAFFSFIALGGNLTNPVALHSRILLLDKPYACSAWSGRTARCLLPFSLLSLPQGLRLSSPPTFSGGDPPCAFAFGGDLGLLRV